MTPAPSVAHEARFSSRCIRPGAWSPACWAIVHPFRFGISLTSADTYLPACCQAYVREKHRRSESISSARFRTAHPAPYPGSLGRIVVPAQLRAASWDLVTLAEHYSIPADEQVADTEWIQEAATHGWPILMKDKRIRYRRAEIDAVIRNQAQCFVITRGDLASTLMAHRLIANKQRILNAIEASGPCIYAVQLDRLDRLYPP